MAAAGTIQIQTNAKDGTKKATPSKDGFLRLECFLPGIELFSQGATPQISSPLLRFTTEFEMDRSGSTALWTPG